MRYDNATLNKRYAEMSVLLQQRELDLEKAEIKSKELLTAAHEDA